VGFFFTPLEGDLNVWHIIEKKAFEEKIGRKPFISKNQQ